MRLIFLIRKRKQKKSYLKPREICGELLPIKVNTRKQKRGAFFHHCGPAERQAPSDFSLPTQVLRTLICQTSCPFQRQLSRQEISHRLC